MIRLILALLFRAGSIEVTYQLRTSRSTCQKCCEFWQPPTRCLLPTK
jgi:hypothetical protein